MADIGSIVITASLVFAGSFTAVCMAFTAGAFLGRALSRRSQARIDAQAERTVALAPDAEFEFATRNFEGQ